MTTLFTVTNAALAQSVSGIVYSNGLTPLPYAVVVARTSRLVILRGPWLLTAMGIIF